MDRHMAGRAGGRNVTGAGVLIFTMTRFLWDTAFIVQT